MSIAKTPTRQLLVQLDLTKDDDEAEKILAELEARRHDHEDPSSGLGVGPS